MHSGLLSTSWHTSANLTMAAAPLRWKIIQMVTIDLCIKIARSPSIGQLKELFSEGVLKTTSVIKVEWFETISPTLLQLHHVFLPVSNPIRLQCMHACALHVHWSLIFELCCISRKNFKKRQTCSSSITASLALICSSSETKALERVSLARACLAYSLSLIDSLVSLPSNAVSLSSTGSLLTFSSRSWIPLINWTSSQLMCWNSTCISFRKQNDSTPRKHFQSSIFSL